MIARFTALICLTISLVSCHKSPSDLFVLEGQVENLKDSTTIELAYYSMINKNGRVIERWEHIGEEQQLKLSNIFK